MPAVHRLEDIAVHGVTNVNGSDDSTHNLARPDDGQFFLLFIETPADALPPDAPMGDGHRDEHKEERHYRLFVPPGKAHV